MPERSFVPKKAFGSDHRCYNDIPVFPIPDAAVVANAAGVVSAFTILCGDGCADGFVKRCNLVCIFCAVCPGDEESRTFIAICAASQRRQNGDFYENTTSGIYQSLQSIWRHRCPEKPCRKSRRRSQQRCRRFWNEGPFRH